MNDAQRLKRIVRYLERHADLERWPLEGDGGEGVEQVVVIPAYDEADTLPGTLESLARNPAEEIARTLVICVVNQRENNPAESNAATLDWLRRQVDHDLRLAWVDAASPERQLPPKTGVGMARKIGMDHAVKILAPHNGAIICLDADTLVDEHYLPSLHRHFSHDDAFAATIPFAHPLDGPEDERAAIICYEIFLRYHALSLRMAGSPYCFQTVGSAMACTLDAYVSVTGMNRRQAGEDFYFLTKLAKVGPVRPVTGTTVIPSSRPSDRVPFGTGARVRRHLSGEQDEYKLHDPESYNVLGRWLAAVGVGPDADKMLEVAENIHPELTAFLNSQGFATAWTRLEKNAPSFGALVDQFHRWFDGFRTFKLVHHLRDTVNPDIPMPLALASILRYYNAPLGDEDVDAVNHDRDTQERVLLELRELDQFTSLNS